MSQEPASEPPVLADPDPSCDFILLKHAGRWLSQYCCYEELASEPAVGDAGPSCNLTPTHCLLCTAVQIYGLTDGTISGAVGPAAWQGLPAHNVAYEANVGLLLSIAADAPDAAFFPLSLTVNGIACAIEGPAAGSQSPPAAVASPPPPVLSSPPPPPPPPSCPTCLRSLVVFGDSLSDTGEHTAVGSPLLYQL